MKHFKPWAPPDLVKRSCEMAKARKEFEQELLSMEARAAWAKERGFVDVATWEKHQSFQERMLFRLLDNPEMEAVWRSIAKRSDPVLIHNVASRSITAWFTQPKLSAAERRKAMVSIARTARELSLNVRMFYQDPTGKFEWYQLMPNREQSRSLFDRVLHPDLVSRCKTRHVSSLVGLGLILPPIHDVLAELAVAAEDPDRSRSRRPRKAHAGTALRSHFIHNMIPLILSPSNLAHFASVALGDDEITIDTVRKHSTYIRTVSALREAGIEW